MKAIEFFCGIGGFAGAFDGDVCLAIDQDQFALETYRLNFSHPTSGKTVRSIPSNALARYQADLWWASPPCQPFTTKGMRRMLADTRAEPLGHLLDHLAAVRPRHFAMENVLGFANSPGEVLVRQTLADLGYDHIQTMEICPSRLGIPNRRPRFYLIASQNPLLPVAIPAPRPPAPLAAYLAEEVQRWLVPEDWLCQFHQAMDILKSDDRHAVAKTFTSGYGRSPVRCGSYLETACGEVRFFTPKEILALLGFPPEFRFPGAETPRQAWKRLGNSLSIPAVTLALKAIPRTN